MRIDRLFGIVIYLLNNGRTSALQLAERFEVSSRTIMRDMESIEQAGIPIQSFYGVDGGYQILDTYVLEKQAVTNDEYEWILAALRGLNSAYASKTLAQTLEKTRSVSKSEKNIVSVDFSVATEDKKVNEQLQLLENAIKNEEIVKFSYVNSHDERKTIQVEPVKLQYKWYNWYLIGYYEKHQDYCMFKLIRMDDLVVTGEKNKGKHDLSNIEEKTYQGHTYDIILLGKAVIKNKCREYLNGRITKEFSNGDFEFSFSVPAHETFWYGVVLSFGDKVEIIQPMELRQRIMQTCKEIQRVYETCH